MTIFNISITLLIKVFFLMLFILLTIYLFYQKYKIIIEQNNLKNKVMESNSSVKKP
jgi:TRAP-type mannitol/chloroaromatic compound transport system permease small subunit